MRNTVYALVASVAAAGISLPATAAAQNPWVTDTGSALAVSLTHTLTENNEFGTASALADISARWQVSPHYWVGVGIPVVHADLNLPAGYFGMARTAATEAGNPWIGFGGSIDRKTSFVVAVRPGIRKNDDLDYAGQAAVVLGGYSDFDHLEAWSDDRSSLRAYLQIGAIPEAGAFATGWFGGTYVPGRNGSESTPLLDYGLRVGYRGRGVIAAVRLSGRYDATSCGGCDLSLGDRMINQVALSVEAASGKVRPMGGVGIFLDPSVRSDSPDGTGIHAMITAGLAVGM
ncbi:MAG: hypothetical protein ACREL5_12025 [Gemmatimonadales bacterium]